MKKISFYILLSLFATNCFSQNHTSIEAPKNVIHGSIGTLIFYFSGHLSYDYLLKEKETGFFKAYYANLNGGAMVGGSLNGNSTYGYLTGIGITGLTGLGENHFELSLGLRYYIDARNESNRPRNLNNQFFPNFSIAYRKQSSKRFMYRTGLGSVEWLFFGVGHSF